MGQLPLGLELLVVARDKDRRVLPRRKSLPEELNHVGPHQALVPCPLNLQSHRPHPVRHRKKGRLPSLQSFEPNRFHLHIMVADGCDSNETQMWGRQAYPKNFGLARGSGKSGQRRLIGDVVHGKPLSIL